MTKIAPNNRHFLQKTKIMSYNTRWLVYVVTQHKKNIECSVQIKWGFKYYIISDQVYLSTYFNKHEERSVIILFPSPPKYFIKHKIRKTFIYHTSEEKKGNEMGALGTYIESPRCQLELMMLRYQLRYIHQ